MNRTELIFKHAEAAYSNKYEDITLQHVKLSIQFAIDVLEDVILNYNKPLVDLKHGLDKIQELKQYLDE